MPRLMAENGSELRRSDVHKGNLDTRRVYTNTKALRRRPTTFARYLYGSPPTTTERQERKGASASTGRLTPDKSSTIRGVWTVVVPGDPENAKVRDGTLEFGETPADVLSLAGNFHVSGEEARIHGD